LAHASYSGSARAKARAPPEHQFRIPEWQTIAPPRGWFFRRRHHLNTRINLSAFEGL
jgi:hypothetical protein